MQHYKSVNSWFRFLMSRTDYMKIFEKVKQFKVCIIRRDVVRFSNPGVLAVMWWTKSAPSGWKRVNRTSKPLLTTALDLSTFVFKSLRRLFDKYAVASTEQDALVKSTTKIFSNFVAFSENPSFTSISLGLVVASITVAIHV